VKKSAEGDYYNLKDAAAAAQRRSEKLRDFAYVYRLTEYDAEAGKTEYLYNEGTSEDLDFNMIDDNQIVAVYDWGEQVM